MNDFSQTTEIVASGAEVIVTSTTVVKIAINRTGVRPLGGLPEVAVIVLTPAEALHLLRALMVELG